VWPSRLPAYCASESITEFGVANEHIATLRLHRHRHETLRELGLTAPAAGELARREKRTVLRPAPRCPWWPYVWSQRTTTRVGKDGWRWEGSGCAWKSLRARRWCSANIPAATTPCWPHRRGRTENRWCYSPAPHTPVKSAVLKTPRQPQKPLSCRPQGKCMKRVWRGLGNVVGTEWPGWWRSRGLRLPLMDGTTRTGRATIGNAPGPVLEWQPPPRRQPCRFQTGDQTDQFVLATADLMPQAGPLFGQGETDLFSGPWCGGNRAARRAPLVELRRARASGTAASTAAPSADRCWACQLRRACRRSSLANRRLGWSCLP
jgi:hypothetical protein